MKRIAFFLCIFLPLMSLLLFLQILIGGVYAKPQMVEVGGSLTADTTWTAVNSPYILTSTVHIPTGITLTVEPGVTVLGKSFAGIIVEGNFVAIGTPTDLITFTSVTDSAPGEWPGFFFWDGSGHFENVAIRYGGEDVSDPIDGKPPSGANVNITNKTDSSGGGDLIFRDSTIHGSNGFGMAVPVPNLHQVELDNVSFAENITNRIEIVTPSSTPIVTDVTLSPQPGLEGYQVGNSGLVVAIGTLTLEPGTAVMVPSSSAIVLQGGRLEAIGTPEKPITFTSITDSAADRWGGIFFWDGSAQFNHAMIRFGGDDVSQPAISALHVYEIPSGKEVTLENSVIYGSGGYAVAVEVDNLHQLNMQNNRFIDNVMNRILLLPDSDGGDGTLAGEVDFPGQDGLESYELMAPGLIVPSGVTMTVGAGATFMMPNNVGILVGGGLLQSVGLESEPIVFSSIADSGAGEWPGIMLVEGTAVFDYTEIRYAVDNLTVNNTAVSQTVSLENSWMHTASNNGLVLQDGAVTALRTQFNDNGNAGIFITDDGDPDFMVTESHIQDNVLFGLINSSGMQVDARNNWWGDASGPGGSSNTIQGNVLFSPWLTEAVFPQVYDIYLPAILTP